MASSRRSDSQQGERSSQLRERILMKLDVIFELETFSIANMYINGFKKDQTLSLCSVMIRKVVEWEVSHRLELGGSEILAMEAKVLEGRVL
ncbi:hypothetical protein M0R45_016984 [Rubus argutus]|uniref:Uncharacterized protein n=1 Tax=Rubus argutus TaxID=59490 RepID=A0AAW1XVP1_RUBAR